MTRARYFAKRVAIMMVTFFIIVTFLFFLFRLMPGDPTAQFVRSGADPETIERFRERWGLDQPIYIQYYQYLQNIVLDGDFGTSRQFGVPVVDYVGMKIFNTFILVAPGVTAGYLVGSLWGTLIGSTDRDWLDRYGITIALVIGTIPIFFLSMIAVIVFGLRLGVVPTGSMASSDALRRFSEAPWYRIYLTKDFAMHWVLPFCVVALRYSSTPALLMRTSIVEVKNQGFAYYQRITGLPSWRRKRHLAKHASLPVITFYPLSMARAVGGLVLVELVFNWPGIGLALIEAVFSRDLPVLQFVFFVVALFILAGNFFIDIIYGWIDPRVSVD